MLGTFSFFRSNYNRIEGILIYPCYSDDEKKNALPPPTPTSLSLRYLPFLFSFLSPALHKSQWAVVADKEVGLEIRRSSDMNLNTLVLCVRSLRCLRSPAESSGAPCCFVGYESPHTQMNISHLLMLFTYSVYRAESKCSIKKSIHISDDSEKRLNHHDQKLCSSVPH